MFHFQTIATAHIASEHTQIDPCFVLVPDKIITQMMKKYFLVERLGYFFLLMRRHKNKNNKRRAGGNNAMSSLHVTS
jgi:hypothetical protein